MRRQWSVWCPLHPKDSSFNPPEQGEPRIPSGGMPSAGKGRNKGEKRGSVGEDSRPFTKEFAKTGRDYGSHHSTAISSSRLSKAGSNGEQLKVRPSISNVGTRRLPPLTLMMNSAASGTSSMLISSTSKPCRFRNCLARQQSGHHRVVYIRIFRAMLFQPKEARQRRHAPRSEPLYPLRRLASNGGGLRDLNRNGNARWSLAPRVVGGLQAADGSAQVVAGSLDFRVRSGMRLQIFFDALALGFSPADVNILCALR